MAEDTLDPAELVRSREDNPTFSGIKGALGRIFSAKGANNMLAAAMAGVILAGACLLGGALFPEAMGFIAKGAGLNFAIGLPATLTGLAVVFNGAVGAFNGIDDAREKNAKIETVVARAETEKQMEMAGAAPPVQVQPQSPTSVEKFTRKGVRTFQDLVEHGRDSESEISR